MPTISELPVSIRAALAASASPSAANHYLTLDRIPIDPRTYGASTSATPAANLAAFQAAFDACPAQSSVEIPDGSFSIAPGLSVSKNYVSIRGRSLTELKLVGTGPIMTVTGNNVTLENLSLTTASNANADNGLYVNGGYGLKLSRVLVTGAQNHGVYLTGNSNSIQTDHCLFDASAALAGYSAFYHGTGSHNVVHIMSRFNGAAVSGAYIADGYQISFISCDISSTTGGANSIGINVAGGGNLLIENCYFEGIGKYFVWLGSGATPVSSPAIRNCYVYVDRTGGTGVQIDYASNAKLSGNTIYGPAGTTGVVVGGADIRVVNCQIDSDNAIETAVTIVDAKGRSQNHYGHRIQFAASVPVDGSSWAVGDVVYNSAPTAGENVGWTCTTAGYAVKENWTTSHAYTTGDFVRSPSTSRLYCATTSGTSGATEPTHSTGSASDGAVTWAYVGPAGDAAIFSVFGQIGIRSRNGSPDGALTSNFQGELLFDVSAYPFKVWMAMNTATAWVQIA